MINAYEFGLIIVDGKEYTTDIIIFPDGKVRDSWWRKDGHRLSIDDLIDLIESQPEIIIAGTGAHGFMQPEKELEHQLIIRGIEFKSAPSGQAIKLYNELYGKKRLGACFHLTC
jgi:hypothetical protein